MEYRKILKRLLEKFEKGSAELHIQGGGRGYGYGSVYTERTPPVYGESDAKRKAREEERKRKNKLNKREDREVEISKRFKEEEITLNELKQLIRSILYEK